MLDKDSIYFVDCQGTNDMYSSMSITKNGNDYLGITGIIQLDQNQASFEVIESLWDLVTVGDVWEFQEMEDSL